MSGVPAENPYRATDAALHDMPTDQEIADAVAVHDRFPLLAKAVGHYFGHYARRWHLQQGDNRLARPWHWPALLFDFYWLMYRKLYLIAFAYLGLNFVAGAVIALVPEAEMIALLAILALKVVLCLSANQLYRWHCERLIRRTQARHPDQPDRILADVERRGGTSGWALGIAIATMFAITLFAEA